METVKKFYEALQADKAMQERADQINEQYKGTDPAAIDQKAAVKAIVEFAKSEGYDFTATELEEYQNEMRALGDEELDAVAGGVFSPASCWCALGGGGVDDEAGGAGMCACVLVGAGARDKENSGLVCGIGGFLDYKCALGGRKS